MAEDEEKPQGELKKDISKIVNQSYQNKVEKLKNTYLVSFENDSNFEEALNYFKSSEFYELINKPIEIGKLRIIQIKSKLNEESTVESLEDIIKRYHANVEANNIYYITYNDEEDNKKEDKLKKTYGLNQSDKINKLYK